MDPLAPGGTTFYQYHDGGNVTTIFKEDVTPPSGPPTDQDQAPASGRASPDGLIDEAIAHDPAIAHIRFGPAAHGQTYLGNSGLFDVQCWTRAQSPVATSQSGLKPTALSFHASEACDIYIKDQGHLEDGYHSEELLEAGYSSNHSLLQCIGGPYPLQFNSQIGEARQWPDVDELDRLRKLTDLHGLLEHIYPERLFNALRGRRLDIVELGTNNVLAHNVPKAMLILFCGRKTVTKYLSTPAPIQFEHGLPKQELRIPQGKANYVGFKIALSWMKRACREEFYGKMLRVTVPHDLFAAISLARTLGFFGLHHDSARVDIIIGNHHLQRPITADELASIWTCVPRNSKYVYQIVNNLRASINAAKAFGLGDGVTKEVRHFLMGHEQLCVRVGIEAENNKYMPTFGTDWCKRIVPLESDKEEAGQAQSETINAGMQVEEQDGNKVITVAKHSVSAANGKSLAPRNTNFALKQEPKAATMVNKHSVDSSKHVSFLVHQNNKAKEKKRLGMLRIVFPKSKVKDETED